MTKMLEVHRFLVPMIITLDNINPGTNSVSKAAKVDSSLRFNLNKFAELRVDT